MLELAEADRVEVLVLVDNVTDNLSTVPDYVDNELPRLWKRGLRLWSGRCMCCAAHGLSCAVTATRGGTSHTLLFDTGPDDSVFERNVERLGFDMGSVEALVLSHGHWDHAGGMLRALEMIAAAQWRPRGADLHASRHVPQPRDEGGGRLDASVRGRAEPLAARTARGPRRSRHRAAAAAGRPVLRQRRDPARHRIRARAAGPVPPHRGRAGLGT